MYERLKKKIQPMSVSRLENETVRATVIPETPNTNQNG